MVLTPEYGHKFRSRAETVIRNRENPIQLDGHTYYRIVLGYSSKKAATESAEDLREMGYLARVVPAHSCTRGRYDLYVRRA